MQVILVLHKFLYLEFKERGCAYCEEEKILEREFMIQSKLISLFKLCWPSVKLGKLQSKFNESRLISIYTCRVTIALSVCGGD